MMQKHLIFFDAKCSLCEASVENLLRIDRKKIFAFAPLQGKTADQELTGSKEYLKKENTLILLEHYQRPTQKLWIRGRAVFRIFWLLGGKWRTLGWLCWTPIGIDLLYRLVARHRRVFKKNRPTLNKKEYPGRFYE